MKFSVDNEPDRAVWRRDLLLLIYERKEEEASSLLDAAIKSGWIDQQMATIYRDFIIRMRDWKKARTAVLPSILPLPKRGES